MAREYRKPVGRPATWPKRITAPPLALELYALIAKLARTPGVFAECHVFEGAALGEIPVIKWEGEVTKLPHVVASHLGLPQGGKQCQTPGCCNPFHYLSGATSVDTLVSAAEQPKEQTFAYGANLEEWVELVEYELDKRGKRVGDVAFEEVRGWILAEDLSDEQIRSALTTLYMRKTDEQ